MLIYKILSYDNDTMKNAAAIHKAMDVIGTKIRLVTICHLMKQPASFNELKRKATGMSSTTLSRTLKSLENNGIVVRKVISYKPKSVEYRLTAHGKTLSTIICQLEAFGEKL